MVMMPFHSASQISLEVTTLDVRNSILVVERKAQLEFALENSKLPKQLNQTGAPSIKVVLSSNIPIEVSRVAPGAAAV